MSEWIEVDRQQYYATMATLREDAHHWRHVAYELAGHDRVKVSAASDVVCDKFIAAGAERIGPRLPRSATGSQNG